MSNTHSSPPLWAIIAILFLAIAIQFVFARPAANDGRLNGGVHLGSMAVYCVNGDKIPAASYGNGGIRVLQDDAGTGKEILFVIAQKIKAVGDKPPRNTLLGSATGPYGTISLYRLSSGEFQINTPDEHGKLVAFIWNGCTPVNYPAGEPSTNNTDPGQPIGTWPPTLTYTFTPTSLPTATFTPMP
jgi:hypothetical protein